MRKALLPIIQAPYPAVSLGIFFVLTAINTAVFILFAGKLEAITKNNPVIMSICTIIMLCAALFAVAILVPPAARVWKIKGGNRACSEEIAILKAEVERQYNEMKNLRSLYQNSVSETMTKTEFFANITHEFKTPISVILGSIQLLEQKLPADSPERLRFGKSIDVMKHNCYRLLRLVNNILDMSRLDSGFVKVNKVNCNLVYLTEEITQSVAPYAAQKNLTLLFDTETEEIITALDIDKMERVLLNLLSNAIKYTAAGGMIQVTVSSKSDKACISVKDTGYGIPRHMQAMVFERFRQVDSQLTRDTEGSGIGLSIVKSFVELHGGSISVVSEEKKGSEFIIELPIQLCEENCESVSSPSITQPRIIEAVNIEFSAMYSHAS